MIPSLLLGEGGDTAWYMADDAAAAGLDGIVFPSQARPGGTSMVIYHPSTRTAAQLRVYDPGRVLLPESLRNSP